MLGLAACRDPEARVPGRAHDRRRRRRGSLRVLVLVRGPRRPRGSRGPRSGRSRHRSSTGAACDRCARLPRRRPGAPSCLCCSQPRRATLVAGGHCSRCASVTDPLFGVCRVPLEVGTKRPTTEGTAGRWQPTGTQASILSTSAGEQLPGSRRSAAIGDHESLHELVHRRRHAVQASEHDDLTGQVVVSIAPVARLRLCHVDPPPRVLALDGPKGERSGSSLRVLLARRMVDASRVQACDAFGVCECDDLGDGFLVSACRLDGVAEVRQELGPLPSRNVVTRLGKERRPAERRAIDAAISSDPRGHRPRSSSPLTGAEFAWTCPATRWVAGQITHIP